MPNMPTGHTNNTNKGNFIVIEGIDGSGKSTLANRLGAALLQNGVTAVVDFEPTGDSPAAKKIRFLLKDKGALSPAALNLQLLELFQEDRSWHIKHKISPALNEGKTLILDRYYFSTAAYQGETTEESLRLASRFHNDPEILKPDLVFFVRITPEQALERLTKRGKEIEIFEKLETLKKIDQNYRTLFCLDNDEQIAHSGLNFNENNREHQKTSGCLPGLKLCMLDGRLRPEELEKAALLEMNRAGIVKA